MSEPPGSETFEMTQMLLRVASTKSHFLPDPCVPIICFRLWLIPFFNQQSILQTCEDSLSVGVLENIVQRQVAKRGLLTLGFGVYISNEDSKLKQIPISKAS